MLANRNLIKIIALALLLSIPVTSSIAAPKKAQSKKTLRVLYWNIQNGMWAGQEDNYDKFVEWINSKNPDICVFCEASTIYATGTADEIPLAERYLPAHWGELCARYGHKYWMVSKQRESKSSKFGVSNYPQAITSRFPLDSVASFNGKKPDSVLVSGSCWARVHVDGVETPVNVVAIHCKTGRHGYNVPPELKQQSADRYEGEKHRRMEIVYTINHSYRTIPNPDSEYWIMCGDFNSYSRKDNFKYRWNDASLGFYAQEFFNSADSPYYDIVAESFPGVFMGSLGKNNRIDYFYVNKPLLNACSDVFAQPDSYTTRVKVDVSKFYTPSDHYPIIVDFKLSKLK